MDGFAERFEGELDRLHRFALSLTRDREEAHDLLHDTFLRAHQGFHGFRSGTNFKAWVFQILVNTFHTRRRRAGKDNLTGWDPELEPAAPDDSIFDRLEGEEILAAIEELPEPFRSTVLLVDREEMRYAEVAQVLDCPVGTVMSRLARGRTLLRSRLAGLAAERGFRKISHPTERGIR
jgi:RNA polymerase sigma-70 factor (ECF subfamily)